MFHGVTQMEGVGNTLWGQLNHIGLKWGVDFDHFKLK